MPGNEIYNPIAECAETRQTVEEVAEWFGRLNLVPRTSDPDYDEQISELSNVLGEATEAFDTKPPVCEMVEIQDCYSCDRCGVNAQIVFRSV